MSKPGDVWTAVKSALTNDATLSGYIKEINDGMREEIITVPAITLEPIDNVESEDRYQHNYLKFRIAIILTVESQRDDKQIVGDATSKGILDIENDIKNAIDTDRTLGGKCVHTVFLDSKYDPSEYPRRTVYITLECWYQQIVGTRT